MAGRIKSITQPRLSLNVLSREEVEQIHTATLDVIETVGVRFPSSKALDIWAANGASVDRETKVVKAPGQLIEAALKQAPPAYTLAARDPAQDLPMDGNHVFVGTDGCGVEVIDLKSGQRRRSGWQDVADIARVADYVEEVAFHWVPVSAQDRPPESRGLHELLAIWQNSTKHIQTESIYASEVEARAAVEMAAVLAGGRAALRQRPILSIMQCTAPPLGHDGGSIDAGLIAAEAGLPVGYMTMTSCASTAPITLAGNLVVGNAEVISALALMQLAYPGAPIYYAAAQTTMDLRSGGYTGRTGYGERCHARAGCHEQRLDASVIAPRHLHDFGAPRRSASQADRRGRRFGSRTDGPNHVERRQSFDEGLGEPNLEFGRSAEGRAVRQSRMNGFDDGGVGMAEDQRTPRGDVVHVHVVLGIPQAAAAAAGDEGRGAADTFEGANGAVDPTGNDFGSSIQ